MIRPLVLAYMVKVLYGNSVVYDYSARKLSLLLGISPASCSRYVKYLIKRNLAYKDSKGNLVIRRLSSKGDKWHNTQILKNLKVDIHKLTFKDIENLLIIEIWRKYGDRQKYIADLRMKRKHPNSTKEMTHAAGRLKSLGYDDASGEKKLLTCCTWALSTLQEKLDLSKDKLYAVMDSGKKAKMLRKTQRKSYQYRIPPWHVGIFNNVGPLRMWADTKGNVWQRESNSYSFASSSLKLDTYRMFDDTGTHRKKYNNPLEVPKHYTGFSWDNDYPLNVRQREWRTKDSSSSSPTA